MLCAAENTSKTSTMSIAKNLNDVRHPEHGKVPVFLHEVVRLDLSRRLQEFQRRVTDQIFKVFHRIGTNVGRLVEIDYGQVPATERLQHDPDT